MQPKLSERELDRHNHEFGRSAGIFFDDPLAEWAMWLAVAVACFALVLVIPMPEMLA